MKVAEYPERTCREPVFGEYQAYSCELAEHAEGPCMSYSVPASVRAREAWEDRQAAEAAAAEAEATKAAAAQKRRRRSARV